MGFVLGDIGFYPHNMGRAVEAIHVFPEPEDRRALQGLVTANPLEDAEAVVKGVGQKVDLRLLPFHKRAIHPDFFGLLHPSQSDAIRGVELDCPIRPESNRQNLIRRT